MKPIRLTIDELNGHELYTRQTFVITVIDGTAEIKLERAPGVDRDTSVNTYFGMEPDPVLVRLAVEAL